MCHSRSHHTHTCTHIHIDTHAPINVKHRCQILLWAFRTRQRVSGVHQCCVQDMFVSDIIVSTAGNSPETKSTLCFSHRTGTMCQIAQFRGTKGWQSPPQNARRIGETWESTAVRVDVLLTLTTSGVREEGAERESETRTCDKRLLLSDPRWLKSHLNRTTGESHTDNSCST